MFKLIFVLLFLNGITTIIFAQDNSNSFFDDADKFFRKYIKDGLVEYKSIKESQADLNKLIKTIEELEYQKSLDSNYNKAVLINGYNLFTIYSIVEKYPVRSPKDIAGFFDKTEYLVGGESFTLNEIENKLRDEYNDPRIHFALVCAAKGCPKLLSSAYVPDKLERQLQEQTIKTLNDDYYIHLNKKNKKVVLSEIFKWYEKDFLSQNRNIIEYLNRFVNDTIPVEYSISYLNYDWRLNTFQQKSTQTSIWDGQSLQRFTPSQMLYRGQFEVKIFNNLYTQTSFYDNQGNRIEDNKRSTYFTGMINFLYGIHSNVNLGLDLFIRSVFLDPMGGSPFSLFEFMGTFETSRTALSSFAPKVKFAPFNNIRNFAVQTSVVFPVASDLEGKENGRPFLDNDAYQWWTQLFYDKMLSDYFLLYMEIGFFLRFRSQQTDFLTPAKIIFNYYDSKRWTLYFLTEIGPAWDGFSWISYYSQLGLGTKFQLSSNLEFELLYTTFPFGKNSGAGKTFNLGFRFVL